MLFNSPAFLFLFLPLFFILYLLADKKYRQLIGLIGSLLFFASFQLAYIPLIGGLVLWNYSFGLGIASTNGNKPKSRAMWGGIAGNLFLLFGFKILTTYGFDVQIVQQTTFGDFLEKLKFPLGLSYLSFQAISYLVDVSRGQIDAERNVVSFALYMMLFPKILVGPISRYQSIAKSLPEPEPSINDVASGIRRFVQGLAKKVLIADTLAQFVDAAFRIGPRSLTIELAWLAVLAYTLQIYFDFSGYTDMALGLGKMMGFSLEENFKFPYVAESVGEFWRRWHISLSNWFRDYVFFPLERKRRRWSFRYYGQAINVMIVFLLTGLWHGITKTFIVWGMLHGIFIAFENLFLNRFLKKTFKPVRHFYLLFTISMTWIVFRAPNLKMAWFFLLRLFGLEAQYILTPFSLSSPLPFIEPSFILALVFGVVFSLPAGSLFSVWRLELAEKYPMLKMSLLLFSDLLLFVLLIASVAMVANRSFNPGIYNNF